MTDAAIAADLHQPLDVEVDFAAKFAFHMVVVVDIFSEFGYVVLVQILDARVGIDARRREDLFGRGQADPVNVGKPDLYTLFSG